MRGKIILIVAAVVAVVLSLHTTVLDRLTVFGARLDLLLAIVVYVSLVKGPVAGVIAGFTLGLLQDAQSQHGLGLNALAKAAVGYAAQFTWEGLDKESVYTQMAVLFLAGLLHNLIFLFLYCGSELTMVPGLWLRVGVPGALYTAVVAPLLVALLSRLTGFRMEFSAASIRKR
jgi:rod shape-determining protein MreD